MRCKGNEEWRENKKEERICVRPSLSLFLLMLLRVDYCWLGVTSVVSAVLVVSITSGAGVITSGSVASGA